jgi:hypothetical protein
VVRQAVCPDGTAVDCARKVVAGLAAAGVLHGAERAVVDGRIELQPVVPLVVGLSMDDPVWDASTFSKNRDRLLKKKVAKRFFQEVLKQARERNVLSDEHFTVDGTLIEAWASLKSFQRKEQEKQENGDEEKDRGNANVNFRGEKRSKRMSRKPTPTRNWRAKEGDGKEAESSRNPAEIRRG